ncbi:MAG TPA: HNH endonuclease signature motif containing protein [Tepidisphaeraceae bacterium]|nr:HNH endonuclease signature motif containing protein [Tepidisphaeraceae bacterium]
MPIRPPIFRSRFQPKPSPELRPSSTDRGYDSVWRRFRAAYLARHPLCCFADDPRHRHECELSASVVDHIKPLSQGGARLDESNVRSVCALAHQRLTQNLKTTGVNELPAVDLPLGFWA